jgi:hypothetical protein
MDSDHYEELCRQFVASQEALEPSEVLSLHIPNASRPDLTPYSHQIDLCWETKSDLAVYTNIANAKWRSTRKIELGDMLQLQKVREAVSAHKAFMFTNVGFTRGARGVAENYGIGLHILNPAFDTADLPRGDRAAIVASISRLVAANLSSAYIHTVEHRGLDFTGSTHTRVSRPAAAPSAPAPRTQRPRTTRTVAPTQTRAQGGPERRAGQGGGREGGSHRGQP